MAFTRFTEGTRFILPKGFKNILEYQDGCSPVPEMSTATLVFFCCGALPPGIIPFCGELAAGWGLIPAWRRSCRFRMTTDSAPLHEVKMMSFSVPFSSRLLDCVNRKGYTRGGLNSKPKAVCILHLISPLLTSLFGNLYF